MPRRSNRSKLLASIRNLLTYCRRVRLLRTCLGVDDAIQDGLDLMFTRYLKHLESIRYLRREKKYRNRAIDVFRFHACRNVKPDSSLSLTPDEFLRTYRMSRENFVSLHGLIKNHPVFKSRSGRYSRNSQNRSEHQLLTLLHYLGHNSMTAFTTREVFHMGYGTHYLYVARAAEAIGSLRDQVINWPDVDEREEISARMKQKFDFPSCVMVGDGTLFPLEFQPRCDDAPDYHGRKYKYSLTCFIMNDDNRRIRSYLAGWPGSVHDNRVFSRTDICRHPEKYFSGSQYMLSDSALENTDFVIVAFKKPPLQPMPVHNELFNTKLACARISAEHTIGILKGRFPWLKNIRMLVTDKKEHMLRILRLIDCCVIIHNLMLDIEVSPNPLQATWLEEDGNISDVDEEGNYITEIQSGSKKDTRRRQLHTYLEYKEYCV